MLPYIPLNMWLDYVCTLAWATAKDEKEGTETPAGGDDNGGEGGDNNGGGNNPPGEFEE